LRQNPFAQKLETQIVSTLKLRKELWYDCQFHQYFTNSFSIPKYTALMCLQFVFLIFGQKDFGAKAAHKMLVKLTLGWKGLPGTNGLAYNEIRNLRP
jgi:hypothetical protein